MSTTPHCSVSKISVLVLCFKKKKKSNLKVYSKMQTSLAELFRNQTCYQVSWKFSGNSISYYISGIATCSLSVYLSVLKNVLLYLTICMCVLKSFSVDTFYLHFTKADALVLVHFVLTLASPSLPHSKLKACVKGATTHL